MASQCYEYDWHVWQKEEMLIPIGEDLPRDVFFIDIRTRDFVVTRNPQRNSFYDDGFLTQDPTGPVKVKSLWIKKNSLLYEEEAAKRVINDALRSMGVPAHLLKVVIEDMVAWGWSMAEYPPNAGRGVLPMVVGFKIMAVKTTDENNLAESSKGSVCLMPQAKRRRVEDSRTQYLC